MILIKLLFLILVTSSININIFPSSVYGQQEQEQQQTISNN